MSSASLDLGAFRRFERDGWEKKATGYHRFFSDVSAHNIAPLLDAAAVRRGTRMLDVGCGPGLLAAAAVERGAETTGIDISEEMLAVARELHPTLDFRQGQADDLPFADGAFDAVVGNLLLPHLPDPPAAMAELARVLSPGGRLAISMWGRPADSRFLGVVVDAVAEAEAVPAASLPSGPPTFRFSDDGELKRLLTDAGLNGVEIRTVAFQQRVPDAEAFWTAMLEGTVRTAALITGQPVEVQRRIRAAFDRLAGSYRVGDGLQVPVQFKIGSGTRH